jgi:invasion protein IalB
MENSMKNLFLAALAALSLSAAVVPAFAASTVGDDAAATRMQQTQPNSGG